MAKFYGIGTGPGDSTLVTIKAVNTIKMLDILYTPEPKKGGDSLALSIVKEYVPDTVEIKQRHFPMNNDSVEKMRKTFYVDEPKPEGNELVILSFAKEKVVVNVGLLEDNTVTISKKPIPMKFNNIYNEEETEYKNVEYTPNLKRPISIIDPETAEELKPVLYFDEETNEVKGKCKLKPHKNYFAFEIRESKD